LREERGAAQRDSMVWYGTLPYGIISSRGAGDGLEG
jgi:hypothetical protein